MRKIVIVFCLTVILGGMANTTFAQKQKVGHINVTELLMLMPGRDSIMQEIEKFRTELLSRLQKMNQEYEAKTQEFYNLPQDASEVIKQALIEDIKNLEERIQNYQVTAENALMEKQTKLMQPFQEKAKNAIDKVAKDNGYSYVMDISSGSIVYFDETSDILNLVLKELGIDREKAETEINKTENTNIPKPE